MMSSGVGPWPNDPYLNNIGSSPFTQLEGSGHSYMVGVGATNSHGYLAKLGQIFNLTPTNRGVSGAVLISDQQSTAGSGWVKLLQDLPRSAGTAPYLPASSMYLVDFGINDLAVLGGGVVALSQIKAALRVVVSRVRAATTGVFEETHASVSFTGFLNYGTSTTFNSGNGTAFGNTNGMTATIAVPADFPGGTIALGMTSLSGVGFTATATVDGSAAGSVTPPTAPVLSGKTNSLGVVLRLTGLAPGAHTIVITYSAITGGYVQFDYWQIEAPEPPFTLLVTQPRLPAGAYSYFSGFPFTPTDAMVGALNVIIRQLAAEFDSRVQVVELDALMNANATYFGTGSAQNQLHPNDAGHSLIANVCLRTLQTGPWNPALTTAA